MTASSNGPLLIDYGLIEPFYFYNIAARGTSVRVSTFQMAN